MKSFQIRLLPCLLFAALFFISCKKTRSEEEYAGTGIGAIRTTGTALETVRNTVIGPAGGKLVSRDGKIQVDIPAGAVAANTTFGITAITSTSDAGLGGAYRITPHIKFSKPVTLTMSYAGQIDSVGSPCYLLPGYQDSTGAWKMVTKRTINEQQQTVSVQTDHFSDWTLLTPFKLTPAYSVIAPGDQVVLTVGAFVRIKLGVITSPGNACNIFAEDQQEEVYVEEYYVLPDAFVDKWISLAGESEGAGRLVRAEKGAIYNSSNHDAPLINPVTILCFLKNRQQPMKAVIRIRPVKLGVYIETGGTMHFYDEGTAHVDVDGMGIEWERTVGGETFHGNIMLRGTLAGSRPWTEENQFHWEPEHTSPRLLYQSFWDDGLKVSSGFVNVIKVGKVGEIIEGHFELSNAGEYRSATGTSDIEYLGVKTVRGSFRVIRRD
jgi:hypothetical protein